MVSYKLDKYDRMFISFVLVVLVIFNFCTLCFADSVEELTPSFIPGIVATENSNVFQSNPNSGINYIQVEPGYRYIISLIGDISTSRILVGSSSSPAVNVSYDILFTGLENRGDTYTYVSDNNDILFISLSPNLGSSYISYTREKIEGQSSAVSDLVDNVGFGQFWGVFESGIDFVGVVVLVAFGLFLVVLAIKKVSKGKSEF